ncbi:MAG: DUF3795 domain-containing protein [Desulfobacteraceae bacterium]|nr:MAG: DUF3795 domain-containing protein [Desulfobacteraceae bacterium]
MTAPCGIDCFNCPAYLPTNNEELRHKVAEALKVLPEQAVCAGCRQQAGIIKCLMLAEPCRVYECSKNKNHQFCFECDDFPCDHLHPYADKASDRPHNTKVFNLCLIKKMGVTSWAESKAKNVRETYFKKNFKFQ